MDSVKTFVNKTLGSVRAMVKDKMEWFVAKDVCDVLEMADVSMSCRRLDDDEKGIVSIDTLGGTQEVLCVNEYGLWQLILVSRKPQAKEFKCWLTH